VCFTKSRLGAFATVLIVYIIAFLGFYLVHRLTYRGSLLLSAFWGDIAATILVWLFGDQLVLDSVNRQLGPVAQVQLL
jgi:hypothetical protein